MILLTGNIVLSPSHDCRNASILYNFYCVEWGPNKEIVPIKFSAVRRIIIHKVGWRKLTRNGLLPIIAVFQSYDCSSICQLRKTAVVLDLFCLQRYKQKINLRRL